ncbi:MAG TPA: transcriptional repressor [Gammaproteobacteria bacterium]|nr:transcriptional repressor [Gammaproteobacteria bacterium]
MLNTVNHKNLTKEEVVDLLRARGITPTQQRIDIARILFQRPQHLSADQVLAAVMADNAHVSKATVYNTLGLFARKRLVREVIVDPSKVFYDSNTHPHHHFYNIDSHTLTDIDEQMVSIETLPAPPEDTELDGVEVIIRVRDKR